VLTIENISGFMESFNPINRRWASLEQKRVKNVWLQLMDGRPRGGCPAIH
jgi:hypothetical protein